MSVVSNASRGAWTALAALAVALCSTRLVAAPGVEFYIAPVVYLTALRLFGLRAGLAAAALTMAPSVLWWGHGFSVALAVAHVTFVEWRRKNSNVDATALFILCIQAPIGWLVIESIYHPPHLVIALQLARKMLNDLCCAAVVDLILTNVTLVRPGLHVVPRRPVPFGAYLRALVNATMAAICVLAAIVQSRQLAIALETERDYARKDVGALLKAHPDLAEFEAQRLIITRAYRPAIEVALSTKRGELDTTSPAARALGCGEVKSASIQLAVARFDQVLDHCDLESFTVAGSRTYALIPNRRTATSAYGTYFLDMGFPVGVAITLSLVLLGIGKVLERTIARWQGVINGLGAATMPSPGVSRFLELSDPAVRIVTANNLFVAALRDEREASEAMRQLRDKLQLRLLENIFWSQEEGILEFDERLDKGVRHFTETVTAATASGLPDSFDDNTEEMSLECQLGGAGTNHWYRLFLNKRRPNGTFATGLLHRMDEPSAILDLLAHRQRLSHIGKTTAMVIHEVRQPLFLVGLVAERAAMDLQVTGKTDPAKLTNDLRRIVENVHRAQDIVSNMTRYSRPDQGRVSECQPVEVIRELLELKGSMARNQGIELLFEHNWPDGATLRISETQLWQVLTNLVDNSIDAVAERQRDTRRVGRIRIALLVDEAGGATILCADNGVGIPPDMGNEGAFRQFVSAKSMGNGTGLGLFITRRLLSRLGARISVVSQDGPGATFKISLPSALVAHPVEIDEN